MVMIGTASDGGWNSSGADGLRRLREKLNAQVDYKELEPHEDWETVNHVDWKDALKSYADQGYTIVFAHGRRFDNVVAEVAPQHPGTRFIITGGTKSGANYASATFKNEETGYLLGVLAGLMTKSNVVGTTAGANIRPHLSTVEAFKLGALSVNPKVTFVDDTLEEMGSGDASADPEGGRRLAEGQIAKGADVLFIRSSTASIGIIKGAEQHGAYVINYAKDLTNIAPKTILANGIQLVPVQMEYLTRLIDDGTFEGKNYLVGLADGALKISPMSPELVPANVQATVQRVEQDIIAGKVAMELQR
jgi:basic membrane protein A